MGFGPFLSKEEKQRINSAHQRNSGGLIQGVGERITPEENERRRRAASPEGMGLTKNLGVGIGPFVSPAQKTQINTSLQQNYGAQQGPPIPKVQIPTGGRSAIKAAERRKNIEAAKTPYVPPAPTSSSSTRQGGRARVTGGVQIGIPQSSRISTQRPNRSSNTNKENPTQNPTRPSQLTDGVEVPALGGGTYTVMGVEYDSASGQAINPDTGKTSSGGYSIDPKTSQRTDYSRGQSRTNVKNVTQTGTNTSPAPMTFDDANSVLAKYGITENGFGEKFSSNQLPVTKGSPYGESSSADNQVMGGSARDSAVIQGGGSVETVIGGDTDLDNVKSTYSGGDKSARRRAFLDYSGPGGSMAALRAAEASDNVFYAEGKHHIANPNAGKEGQSDFMAISKEDNYNIATGKQTAQGLRDQYVNKLKGNGSAQEISEASQNAPEMLPDAVPGNTPMDKSPFDTQDLMNPKKVTSIIGNNTPYTSVKPGTVF